MSLGNFTQEQVRAALQLANGSMDVAAQILMQQASSQ